MAGIRVLLLGNSQSYDVLKKVCPMLRIVPDALVARQLWQLEFDWSAGGKNLYLNQGNDQSKNLMAFVVPERSRGSGKFEI